MKTSIKDLILLLVLFPCLSLVLPGPVTAQTFKVLHTFSGSEGQYPWSGVILSGNTLYGTAVGGGSHDSGTVFALNTDGSGFTDLYSLLRSVGASPFAGLVLSDSTLYGTTAWGGDYGWGTVFAVNTDGTGAATLYSFTPQDPASDFYGINSDGHVPLGSLILSGNTLYGTAERGGASGYGTVFSVNTDGSGFTTVYSFTAPTVPGGSGTNSDGAVPWSGVILSGNVLYGTATQGGSYGNGTIFAINTDGKGFTNLYNFTAVTTNSSGAYTNSDGGGPNELILSDNTLYGTAEFGGASGCGTVFSVNTDGSGFTNLYNFTADSDGFDPNALILSGNTLYRTAQRGGKNRNGTVFKVNTDDSGFTTLYRFTDSDNTGANSDGWWPGPGLVLAGDTLYGTSQRGGKYANGTVFSLTLPPPELKLTASGANIVLTWPTNATGFTLQSATALANGGDWQDSTLKVTVVGDQNVVTVDTTAPTAPAAFFRLRGP